MTTQRTHDLNQFAGSQAWPPRSMRGSPIRVSRDNVRTGLALGTSLTSFQCRTVIIDGHFIQKKLATLGSAFACEGSLSGLCNLQAGSPWCVPLVAPKAGVELRELWAKRAGWSVRPAAAARAGWLGSGLGRETTRFQGPT